jgi:hypothetical protein
LTDDTVTLGATAKQWDQTLSGGFQHALEVVKARARNIDLQKKIDLTDTPLDLVTSLKRDRDRQP